MYLNALLKPMRHDRLTYWRGTANGLPTYWLFGLSISFNAFGSSSLVNASMHVCCAITIMLFIDLLLVLGYWSAMSMWFNSMKSPGKSEATLNIIVINPSKKPHIYNIEIVNALEKEWRTHFPWLLCRWLSVRLQCIQRVSKHPDWDCFTSDNTNMSRGAL